MSSTMRTRCGSYVRHDAAKNEPRRAYVCLVRAPVPQAFGISKDSFLPGFLTVLNSVFLNLSLKKKEVKDRLLFALK